MSSIKEQIAAVRAVVTNYSNDQIVLVLQHHDYDVDKAIADFLEGRAKDILTEWKRTGTKSNKTKKKKKQQQKKKTEEALKQKDDKVTVNGVQPPAANGTDLPAKTSSEEISSDNTVTNPQAAAIALKHMLTNGIGSDHSQPNAIKSHPTSLTIPHNPAEKTVDVDVSRSNPSKKVDVEKNLNIHHLNSNGRRSRTTSESSAKAKANRRKHKGPSNLTLTDNHENSNVQSMQTQASLSAASLNNKKSIEKAARDLQRCAVSFGRYRTLLGDEINDSYKRIKQAFEEMSNALVDREIQLMRKLDEMKEEAYFLLSKREERAAELKRQTDRVGSMSAHQVNELRNDIKHFVAERKYDEELGRTTRFTHDKDLISKIIPSFGEISAVKNSYSAKPHVESAPPDISTPSHPLVPEVSIRNDAKTSNSIPDTSLDIDADKLPTAELASPDWADSVDTHPLTENRASWASDTPLVSPHHQVSSAKPSQSNQPKPQRQRHNRQNYQRENRRNGPNHSAGKDNTIMPPPQQIPSRRHPEHSGRYRSDDRDPREDNSSREHQNFSGKNHNNFGGFGDGFRNSPRGKNRGGYRGGSRGNPRGGYRNYPNDRYSKHSVVNGDANDVKADREQPSADSSSQWNRQRNPRNSRSPQHDNKPFVDSKQSHHSRNNDKNGISGSKSPSSEKGNSVQNTPTLMVPKKVDSKQN